MFKNLIVYHFLFFLFTISSFASYQNDTPLSEGQHYAEISGGKIWYHVIGEGDNTPLLLLHGGPGGTSFSLYRLAALSDERPVILFDQLGTGRSDILNDTSIMTVEYFVDQLHEFIEVLGLKKYYLYGHSWGSMLGIDYYLKYPQDIEALILNSPLVSTAMWMQDAKALIATLPDSIQNFIRINEANKTYDSPDYQYAISIYYKNYFNRYPSVKTEYGLHRVPGNNKMYMYMWGPSEFIVTGTLMNYDRLKYLAEIKVPTLFIAGEYDEARPETVKYYSTLVPNSTFAIIKNAAHGTMLDNPEENVQVIRDFIHNLEKK